VTDQWLQHPVEVVVTVRRALAGDRTGDCVAEQAHPRVEILALGQRPGEP
jgi:hypothetical protein